jgi:hypothetical protein
MPNRPLASARPCHRCSPLPPPNFVDWPTPWCHATPAQTSHVWTRPPPDRTRPQLIMLCSPKPRGPCLPRTHPVAATAVSTACHALSRTPTAPFAVSGVRLFMAPKPLVHPVAHHSSSSVPQELLNEEQLVNHLASFILHWNITASESCRCRNPLLSLRRSSLRPSCQPLPPQHHLAVGPVIVGIFPQEQEVTLKELGGQQTTRVAETNTPFEQGKPWCI